MNKKLINLVLIILVLLVGVIYGITIYKYEIFPHQIIKKLFHSIKNTEQVAEEIKTNENSGFYDLWSIGIFEGSSPFDLTDPENISNPVIQASDVDDIDASYVADPFMMIENGKYYLFFEVFNWETYQGDIAYAESIDGNHWVYKNIILDEIFHLSYPYIFRWENDYYLIPESHEDLAVKLYKAVTFPDKWEYIGNILTGYHYVDPSIFRYNDKWWLFVATPGDDVLNLYYSKYLLGEWKPHPFNPIVKLDKNIARPGGRVIIYDGLPYRFTQDCYPVYGNSVFAFKITELTENSYVEKIVSKNPIVNMTGHGWNATGMHQVDLHKIGDKWVAAVDGRKQ